MVEGRVQTVSWNWFSCRSWQLQCKLVNIRFKIRHKRLPSSTTAESRLLGKCSDDRRGGLMSLEDSIALRWVTLTPGYEEAASVYCDEDKRTGLELKGRSSLHPGSQCEGGELVAGTGN